MHAADLQLHSQPADWERSHQGSWEHSQLAWSEHYTIYNAATGSVIENKPNSKVMIRVDGSRRVTMRNRKFVRPMEPMLRNSTKSEPARRRTTQRPPIRQELPKENPPCRPPVQTEHVDEAPTEEHGG
jgi:hypothetical protein